MAEAMLDHNIRPEDITVYVVDDERRMALGVERYLRDKGYHAVGFTEPDQAAEAIRKDPPSVLLTDKDMPGTSGMELAQLAVDSDPPFPVIIMTGNPDVGSAAEAVRMGVTDYLQKPFDLQILESRIWMAAFFHARQVKARERASENWTALEEARERLGTMQGRYIAAMAVLLEVAGTVDADLALSAADTSEALAVRLDLPAERQGDIRLAAFLHVAALEAGARTSGAEHPPAPAEVHSRAPLQDLRHALRRVRLLDHLVEHVDSRIAPDDDGHPEREPDTHVAALAASYTHMTRSGGLSPDEALARLRDEAYPPFPGELVDALDQLRPR